MTFTTFTDSFSFDSLELRRVLIALRTRATLGTGVEELNTSLLMTTAEPDL
jgi:hypothetical protein